MSRKSGAPGLDQLLNMNLDDDAMDDGVDDDLEEELNALLAGKPVARPRIPSNPVAKQPPGRPNRSSNSRGNIPSLSHMSSIEQMKDDDFNEDDLNDDKLMAELQGIIGTNGEDDHRLPDPIAPNVFLPPAREKRIPMPEPPQLPARRHAPPPPMSSSDHPPQEILKPRPQLAEPSIPEPDYALDDKTILVSLRDGYAKAALNFKRRSDNSSALEMMKVKKELEAMISVAESGQTVDMTNLPPPAPSSFDSSDSAPTRSRQNPEEHTMHLPPDLGVSIPEDVSQEDASRLFNAPKSASSVLEALTQRMEKYKETAAQAEAKGDSSKVRRLGRITKQYETAIKAHKSGKEFDYSSLPAPPGFPEIPTEDLASAPPPPVAKPTQPPQSAPPAPVAGPSKAEAAKATPPRPKPAPLQRRQSSIHSKQLSYLVERQRLFKDAALEAKKRGDHQVAIEYMKQMKGFDPLIEATKSGLPIDATSIPTPPQLTDDFVMVTKPDPEMTCDDLEKGELYRKVEMELNEQIEMCKRNKEHFAKLGDVTSAAKFEKYQIESMKDMDMLRTYWKNGDRLPRYRYETRTFSIVQSNPDLGTNEAGVIVLKAIDLPGKDDLDTFVKVEFPFPTVSSNSCLASLVACCSNSESTDDDRRQETPQVGKTRVVKDTINPVFHEKFKFDIDRKSRSLARIFKRHPLKVEVFSKGGFLRSDVLIGYAVIKLNELETKCTLHDSHPLLDGRKNVGGRIEVKVMIREPLLAKQVEEVKEKWLVFD